MDNLRAVIHTYFVDRNLDSVLSYGIDVPIPARAPMESAAFMENFLNRNTMFGTDSVQGIDRMVQSKWLNGEYGETSVFNILLHASRPLLTFLDGELVCKYNQYLRWNELTDAIGEDLLTTAFLADIDVHNSDTRPSFGWKLHLTTDNSDLANILNKGLSELHYHLKASCSVFDINWISLMNSCSLADAKSFSGHRPLTIEIMKASAIRLYLYDFNFGHDTTLSKEIDDLVDKIIESKEADELLHYTSELKRLVRWHNNSALIFDGHSIDYAIPSTLSVADKINYQNICVIGERRLLYTSFKNVFSGKMTSERFETLLYAYILVRNHFRQFVVQDYRIKGFSHFQRYNNKKKSGIPSNSIYEDLVSFQAIHGAVGNEPIRNLEARIVPKNSHRKLRKEIKHLNDIIDNSRFRLATSNCILQKDAHIGFIIHFIKSVDDILNLQTCSLRCRNHKVRKKIERQARAIECLISHNDTTIQGGIIELQERYPIVGIDAAGSEFGCRPEVFASVFRRLKHVQRDESLSFIHEIKKLQLGRTYHVGEDYYDIVDGLRAVDECIYFLEMGHNDRLGHAVALGIDVMQYYSVRHHIVVIPKQDLLDNIVWLLSKLDIYELHSTTGLHERLINDFNRYFTELYGYNRQITYRDYYLSMRLRGDVPSPDYPNNQSREFERLKEIDHIRKNPIICQLYVDYHYDANAKIKGQDMVEYRYDRRDIEIIERIQRELRKEVAAKQISVETNPTSNLKITDVDRYDKHPVTVFTHNFLNPEDKEKADLIISTINTDDQGIFSTSLEKEYTLMALALEKQLSLTGERIYRHERIMEWLEKIVTQGNNDTFIR